MSDRPKVSIGETKKFGFEAFKELVEQEKAAEREREMAEFGHAGTRLTVTIRASVDPIARLEQIEWPLRVALGDNGIVWGGGSFMTEGEDGMEISEVDIGVSVADETQGIAIIKQWLEQNGYGSRARVRRTGAADG